MQMRRTVEQYPGFKRHNPSGSCTGRVFPVHQILRDCNAYTGSLLDSIVQGTHSLALYWTLLSYSTTALCSPLPHFTAGHVYDRQGNVFEMLTFNTSEILLIDAVDRSIDSHTSTDPRETQPWSLSTR